MPRTVNFSTTDTVTEPFFACELGFSGSVTRNINVKVVSTGDGNVYSLDGQQPANYELYVSKGNTIKFLQHDTTNTNHPLRLSTTPDGTHGGGSEYTTGVTYSSASPGSAGAYTQWVVDSSLNYGDKLYYYCSNHSGMGGSITVLESTYRLWTGYGEITIGSDTYYGVGDYGNLSVVRETEKLEATGVTLTLSGLPNNMVSDALLQNYQGQNANIYFGTLANGQLTQQPYLLFSGKMDVMNVVQQAENSAITIQCENYLAELRRSKVGRYTDQDQQSRFAGDTSLRFVDAIQQDKEILWGVPFSTVGRQIKPVDPGDIDIDDILKGGFPF